MMNRLKHTIHRMTGNQVNSELSAYLGRPSLTLVVSSAANACIYEPRIMASITQRTWNDDAVGRWHCRLCYGPP
jgi:hypothetical protein